MERYCNRCDKFKYISCYGSSDAKFAGDEAVYRFKYISCYGSRQTGGENVALYKI